MTNFRTNLLVKSLYADPSIQNIIPARRPVLLPVHIKGAEFYRGQCPPQPMMVGNPCALPEGAAFRQSMRHLSCPSSETGPLSEGSKAFLLATQEASSFMVTWYHQKMEPMRVHVGVVMPAEKVYPARIISTLSMMDFSPEEMERIAQHNKKHVALTMAVCDAHRSPDGVVPPQFSAVSHCPVVVRADNSIVIPVEGDYVANPDGDIVWKLEKCRLVSSITNPAATEKGGDMPQQTPGCHQPCHRTRTLDVLTVTYRRGMPQP